MCVAGRFAPVRSSCAVVQCGGIQPKETAGILPTEDARANISGRCGSDGLQVRTDGYSFGRRVQLDTFQYREDHFTTFETVTIER